MEQLQSVLKALKTVSEQETEAKRQAEANEQMILELRRKAIVDWLRVILEAVGIFAPIVDSRAQVDGFTFTLKMDSGQVYPQYYPMVLIENFRITPGFKPSPSQFVVHKFIRCTLVITSDLDAEYRKQRPDSVAAYAQHSQTIEINERQIDGNWLLVGAAIGEAILFLQKEKDEAPDRKQRIDTEHQKLIEARRQEEAEREAAWKAERERQNAQYEEQRKEAEARQEEYKRKQAEQKAYEAQLRAEVAAKVGVSADAFDYLIEAIADELSRRHKDIVEDYEY